MDLHAASKNLQGLKARLAESMCGMHIWVSQYSEDWFHKIRGIRKGVKFLPFALNLHIPPSLPPLFSFWCIWAHIFLPKLRLLLGTTIYSSV